MADRPQRKAVVTAAAFAGGSVIVTFDIKDLDGLILATARTLSLSLPAATDGFVQLDGALEAALVAYWDETQVVTLVGHERQF